MSLTYQTRKRVGVAAAAVTLSVIALALLAPLAWMLLVSFKKDADIFSTAPLLWPEQFTPQHYANLFGQFHFAGATVNSVLIAVATVAIGVTVGGLAAYGFSRYPWRGSGIAVGFLMVTRMVTPASLVLPLYLLMQKLGMLNTVTSVIVGVSALNLPFVVWLLKPFFDTVPKEVEEAALLDGLTPVRVFFRIAIPLAAPGLMTVVLYSFLAGWTDLLFPMTLVTAQGAMPLTSGLLQMQTGYKIYWGELMAGGVYLTIPALIICFALQKCLLRGLRTGFGT